MVSRRIIQASILGIAFFLPLSSGIVNSLIGIGILFWLARKIAKKEFAIRPTKLNLPLFLFFVISCVSVVNSAEPATSLRGLVKVLKYLGIYFLMVENIEDARFAKNIITALILGAVAVCLDGLFQYIAGKDLIRANPLIVNFGLRRMTAAFRHCNDFGVYLVTVAGIIWALALYVFKGKMKFVGLLAAFLITLCIGLTFSRGALLGFFGAMLAMGLVKRDKVILVFFLAGLLAIPILMPASIKEWGRGTHTFLEFFCNLDRITFYKSSIQMIKDHPFIGVGINTFMKAYPKYKVHDVDIITGDYAYAHNNYLQMAGEIGLIGLAIFLWVVVALFLEVKRLIRAGPPKAAQIHSTGQVPSQLVTLHGNLSQHTKGFVENAAMGLGCGIVAFLLNGLTESSFYFSKIVVVFWFVVGLAVSLRAPPTAGRSNLKKREIASLVPAGLARNDGGKMKILVIRTDRIGEVLLTTPILTALKERWPDSKISVMIRPEVRELIEDNPSVSEIIEYEKEEQIRIDKDQEGIIGDYKGKIREDKGIGGIFGFANFLRKKKFDMAIIVNPKKEFHLAAFLAGIPIRVGFDRKWGFLLTHRAKDLKYLAQKHEIEYNLDLVRALGIAPKDKRPVLVTGNGERVTGSVSRIPYPVSPQGSSANNFIAIHPCTSNPKKQWPKENFAKLGDLLIENGYKAAVVSGPREIGEAGEVISKMKNKPMDLAGKLTLKELVAVFKGCKCLISGDSGPVHIAAAVGTPVVAIFGKEEPGSNPIRWGPYGEGHIVVEKERLEDIMPEEVLQAILNMNVIARRP